MIDIAGTGMLFGPPRALAENLLERIHALCIAASIAVSSNFYAAVCLARGLSSCLDPIIVEAGEERTALAALPLSALDLSEGHAETFSLWGINTLGMLADLPETSLIARIGQEDKRLRQLTREEMPHLFLPIEPAFTLGERMELDTPVELLDSLLFVVEVMLEQLILRAKARILALASVTVTLSLEGGRSHTRTVRPALPTNDRQLWIKLLHLDLEAHPPQTAIVSLALTAEPGNTSKVQLGMFSPQLSEPARLDVSLARIRAIVGEGCVGRAVLRDTHQPDGFRMEPFTVPSGSARKQSTRPNRTAMRACRPAENVLVTLRDKRPESFLFQERRYSVKQAYGPWLQSGDWWNPTLWGLQQWDLVARSHDGFLLCCCLTHELNQKRWQMVGLYD